MQSIILFYDKHENGFYPFLRRINIKKSSFITEIVIIFKLINYINNYAWQQDTGSVIYGFDDYNGYLILEELNKNSTIIATNIINCGGRVIYPTTENTTYLIMQINNKIKKLNLIKKNIL